MTTTCFQPVTEFFFRTSCILPRNTALQINTERHMFLHKTTLFHTVIHFFSTLHDGYWRFVLWWHGETSWVTETFAPITSHTVYCLDLLSLNTNRVIAGNPNTKVFYATAKGSRFWALYYCICLLVLILLYLYTVMKRNMHLGRGDILLTPYYRFNGEAYNLIVTLYIRVHVVENIIYLYWLHEGKRSLSGMLVIFN